MSAFVVSKEHIDAIVAAAMPSGAQEGCYWYRGGNGKYADYTNADEIGRMLWDECVRSVSYRYPDNDPLPGGAYFDDGTPESEAYVFPLLKAPKLEPVAALKAIQCYEYQSCEHPGWDTSEAKTFCSYLIEHLIQKLPGYAEAAWSV
jgi:hypothetical protein